MGRQGTFKGVAFVGILSVWTIVKSSLLLAVHASNQGSPLSIASTEETRLNINDELEQLKRGLSTLKNAEEKTDRMAQIEILKQIKHEIDQLNRLTNGQPLPPEQEKSLDEIRSLITNKLNQEETQTELESKMDELEEDIQNAIDSQIEKQLIEIKSRIKSLKNEFINLLEDSTKLSTSFEGFLTSSLKDLEQWEHDIKMKSSKTSIPKKKREDKSLPSTTSGYTFDKNISQVGHQKSPASYERLGSLSFFNAEANNLANPINNKKVESNAPAFQKSVTQNIPEKSPNFEIKQGQKTAPSPIPTQKSYLTAEIEQPTKVDMFFNQNLLSKLPTSTSQSVQNPKGITTKAETNLELGIRPLKAPPNLPPIQVSYTNKTTNNPLEEPPNLDAPVKTNYPNTQVPVPELISIANIADDVRTEFPETVATDNLRVEPSELDKKIKIALESAPPTTNEPVISPKDSLAEFLAEQNEKSMAQFDRVPASYLFEDFQTPENRAAPSEETEPLPSLKLAAASVPHPKKPLFKTDWLTRLKAWLGL